MKRKIFILAAIGVIVTTVFALRSFSQTHKGYKGGSKVMLYGSNGGVIKEWKTPYEVKFNEGSFSFYSEDHLIQLTGTVVVETMP